MTDLTNLANLARVHLSSLNSPAATPAQIVLANKALDDLKNSLTPPTALQLCEHLLAPLFASLVQPPSLPAIHYAFHILDARLLQSTQPWTSFPDDTRAAVRTLATTLISRLQPSHPSLLKQKSITLLVALALREWPQRWPNFLDQLLVGVITPTIVCSILFELSDQVYIFSNRIQSVRRQDLRQAMNLSLPQMLAFITKAIQHAHDKQDVDAMTASLECLHSFVHWADLQALFSATVPTACLTLLSHKQVRDAALGVLDTFFSRQVHQSVRHSDEKDNSTMISQSHAVFRETMFPNVLGFVAQSPFLLAFAPFSLVAPTNAFPPLVNAFNCRPDLGTIDADNHEFCIRFFQVIAELGSNHFVPSFLFDRKTNRVALSSTDLTCAASYIDLLVLALASPSLALRNSVLPFFTALYSAIGKHPNSESFTSDEFILFVTTAFIQTASVGLIKFPDDAATKAFAELDDTDEAQAYSMVAISSRLSAAIGIAARITPGRTAALTAQRFSSIIMAKPSVPVVVPSNAASETIKPVQGATARHRGIIVADGTQHGWTFGSFTPELASEWRACMEASCLSLESVTSGVIVSEDKVALDGLMSVMQRAFEVIQCSSDVIFLPVKPLALRALHLLYIRDEKALTTCLEGLLSMASESSDNGHGGLRGKIFNALSSILRKLNTAHVQSIETFSQPLCTYATGVLCSKSFRSMEKINLMEAALASVMAMSDMSKQSECVEQILNPVLSYLSSEQLGKVLRTPQGLLEFLEKGGTVEVEELCEAFLMMEAGMHQVVRPVSKGDEPIHFPGILSRCIAPKAADLSCVLITSLNGVYNGNVGTDRSEEMESILQPTSHEIAYVLNMDTMEHFPKGIADLVEHDGEEESSNETKASKGEMRSANALSAYGISPPDERYGRLRERLRDLRRAGYEMMRAAILSGATRSNKHLSAIVQAVCDGAEQAEPIHLLSILGRIIAPMFSFGVCGDAGDFVETAGECGVTRFWGVVREHIVGAQRGVEIFSPTQLMGVVRDHGRRRLARTAADAIAMMYPRTESGEERLERGRTAPYVPPALRSGALGSAIVGAWCDVCDAGRGTLDHGAARVALSVVGVAADVGGDGDFPSYALLLIASIRTAVVCYAKGNGGGDKGESAFQPSIGSVVALVRRWPRECETALVKVVARGREEVIQWIADCVNGFGVATDASTAPATKVKRHRVLVKALVQKIATAEGMTPDAVAGVVHALPEKFSINGGVKARSGRRRRAHNEDVDLTDSAIDSLFGNGEPL